MQLLNINKKLKEPALILIIILFSFYLRIIFISRGPYHLDTLELAIQSQKTLDTLRMHYQHAPGYPLTVILGAIVIFIFRLFGVYNPILSVNFMSIFFSSLNILLFYLFVKKLIDIRSAFFSALLFSFFPAFLAVSTFGKSHAISIMFALLSAYFMLIYVREGKKLRDLYLSGLFLGLQGLSRPQDTLIIIPLSLFFFEYNINLKKLKLNLIKPIIKHYFLFIIAFILPLLFYIHIIVLEGFWNFLRFLREADFSGLIKPILPVAIRFIIYMFTGLGFIIAILGAVVLSRNARKAFYFLFAWFLCLTLFFGNIKNFDTRYLILAIMPLIIFEGYELSRLFNRNPVITVAILTFLILNMFLIIYPVLELRHSYSLQEEFAKLVNLKTKSNSIIIAQDESLFLEYYADRKTVKSPISCDKKLIDRFFVETIDSQLNKGIPVYLMETSFAYDPCNLFSNEIFKNYKMKVVASAINEDWHSRTVTTYLAFPDSVIWRYFHNPVIWRYFHTSLFREHLYEISKRVF